jgi:hypothetical protein
LASVVLPALDALGQEQPSPSKSPTLDISVQFDKASYTLKVLPTGLTYKDYSQTYEIPSKECSRKVINRIVNAYAQLEAIYHKDQSSKRVETKYDVVVKPGQGPSFNVSRGNNFGTWLRDVPQVISYNVVEAALDCHGDNPKD